MANKLLDIVKPDQNQRYLTIYVRST